MMNKKNNKMKNYNQILQEEIDAQCKKFDLNPKELKGFMNELFTFNSSKLLRSLGNQDEILDDKDSLPEEFWEEIINNINDSYSEGADEWEKELKEIKFQILCYKYFTKQDLEDLDSIEKKLKVQIKKYFSSLQNYTSLENFRERFFNLPSDLLFNFVRYILNKSTVLNKKISISKIELKDRVDELKEQRSKVIDKISFISNRNVSVLDLKNVKRLIDNGVFYEDNLLNRGVNEYMYKLAQHKEASHNIVETFNSTFLNDLKLAIETSQSYLNHISSIKNEETAEYFTVSGIQVGRKFDNEIDAVKNKDVEDAVIDKDSIFKEPKGRIKSSDFAWDSNAVGGTGESGDDAEGDMGAGSDLGGGGGGFSGGGGGSMDIAPGSEEVDVDMGGEEGEEGMPTGDDGLPTDFGTPDSNTPSDEGESDTDDKDKESNSALSGQ